MKFWPVFKEYAHQVSVAVALVLIFELGQVATYKFAMGKAFPDNWGEYIWALVALAGVNVGGMGLLRATNPALAEARARGKAQGAPTVNVEGDANVQTAATAELPVPQAGVKPRNADVRRPIEEYAERQRAADGGGAPDDGAVG